MQNQFVKGVSIALGLLALAACAGRTSSGGPSPVQPNTIEQSELEILQESERSLLTMRSLLSGKISIDGNRASLRYVVVYRSPEHVRVEILPPGAAYSLVVMTSRSGQGEVIDIENKRFYSGSLTPAVMKKFIGFPVEISDLPSFLMGTIPPSVRGDLGVLRNGNDLSAETTIFANARGTWKGWFSRKERRLIRQELRSVFDDSVLMDVTYHAYGDCSGMTIPFKTEVVLGQDDRRAQLSFRGGKCNSEVPDKIFNLQKPEGYAVRTLQ